MAEFGFTMQVILSAAAVLLVLSVLLLGSALRGRRRADTEPQDAMPVFLYQRGVLVDANLFAHQLLAGSGAGRTDWSQLVSLLEERFPKLPKTLGSTGDGTYQSIASRDSADTAFVTIEQTGDSARVCVHQAHPPAHPESEDTVMQQALADAPYPIWHRSDTGEIMWVNRAYRQLAEALGLPDNPATPAFFENLPATPDRTTLRTSITNSDRTHSYWYDIRSVPAGSGFTHYATDANAIVNAEVAQRNFVQTLTKTFAQLSIGLALFDRNRQLALFNPALIDLTALPADFLSSRPNLLTFFDRLRENRVMPEPKNYSSWREQIAELVVAAADDRYCETWTLPSGVTYRVVGRPHPDGAIALLFEDISAEVSLTRRFRAELELGQSILDALESPIAVFSPVGSLTFCNTAYQDLWDDRTGEQLTDFTIDQAIAHWKAACEPSGVLDRIRSHALDLNQRGAQNFPLELRDGGQMTVSVSTVSGGATLVAFTTVSQPTDRTLQMEKVAI